MPISLSNQQEDLSNSNSNNINNVSLMIDLLVLVVLHFFVCRNFRYPFRFFFCSFAICSGDVCLCIAMKSSVLRSSGVISATERERFAFLSLPHFIRKFCFSLSTTDKPYTQQSRHSSTSVALSPSSFSLIFPPHLILFEQDGRLLDQSRQILLQVLQDLHCR